jgi:hypothetical protein
MFEKLKVMNSKTKDLFMKVKKSRGRNDEQKGGEKEKESGDSLIWGNWKTMVMMLIVGVVMGCSEVAEHYGSFQAGETDGENAHCDSE